METSLYAPVKRFLEGLGFEVKGEVCGCDLVALDRGTPAALVIGELKLTFTLDLVLQDGFMLRGLINAARRAGADSDAIAAELETAYA